MLFNWYWFHLANGNPCDTIECKVEVFYLLQMNVILSFVLLNSEVMLLWLLYWGLFAGCTMGFQKIAELDSQRVQQSNCLDNREWIPWPRRT
jgi:hypothetical protein